jgi:hypothetical protein
MSGSRVPTSPSRGGKAVSCDVRASVIVQFERGSQRFVQPEDLLTRKHADEVGQHGFRDAHEFVAMDAAVVLHPFIRADWHLRRETLVRCVDGGADDS